MTRRHAVITVTLGLVVLGVSSLYIWANKPSVTTVSVQQNVKGVSSNDFVARQIDNAFFSAQFPARFTQKRSSLGNGKPILLQQLYSASASGTLYTDQLAITVGELMQKDVISLSDVQLRQRTNDYKQLFPEWLNSKNALVYERSQPGYELGVFIGHEDRYTGIVLSGLPSNKDNLGREMQLLVSSLKWY